ncbi:MAG: universal stress protein [Bacteroidia bacterium]|nr:universal stress protein [Bacteroidia bacterium]MCX7651493.1 universal stress protein [Bacteroidia bacterium]MDW8416752.1 universal stress protein [Bacteroidia bacterium]
MAKLIAGIDYSPASVRALEALIPIRKATKQSIALYHAYQLPKGLPFLSAHVIEDMEMEAEKATQQKLRRFLHDTFPPADIQRVKIITQRDFLTDGLFRHLETGKYILLAMGARGETETEKAAIGFHARHFIRHSPIPVLITFPQTQVRWKRLLIAYHPNFHSPIGKRLLRLLTQKLVPSVAGVALLPPTPAIEKIHKKIRQQLTHGADYQPVVWESVHLVRLLLETSRSYEADVIAYFSDPMHILPAMRSIPESEIDSQAAWLFFPSPNKADSQDNGNDSLS